MNMVRRVVEKLVLSSLGRNRIFGDGLLQVHWVSKIILTKNREDEIKKCLPYAIVKFHYPNDVGDFNLLIETFQKDTINDSQEANNNDENCNVFGENKKIDNLIVTDMDLGLADNSNDF